MRHETTVRVARPSNKLDKVVRFYQEGLGLTEIFRFKDHDGFDGVILGMEGHTPYL